MLGKFYLNDRIWGNFSEPMGVNGNFAEMVGVRGIFLLTTALAVQSVWMCFFSSLSFRYFLFLVLAAIVELSLAPCRHVTVISHCM